MLSSAALFIQEKEIMTGMVKGKILIVDDSIWTLELLEETLKPFDYEILKYSNPLEALEDTIDTKIDLAVIDVVMDELNGFEFSEKFLNSHTDTPIAFISGYAQKENKIKGFNLGSYIYIEKPFDINTVRAQIQNILKVKTLQDELLYEKQKLEDIFEFTSNEIILADLDFNIVSQNNKILNKKKYKKDTNFIKLLEKYTEEKPLSLLNDFISSAKNSLQFRIILDSSIYLKTTVSKIKTGNYHSGYLIVMENITEEIEKQNIINSFIEMITHDLKTPVRAEKRALSLLYEGSFGELNPDQREIVQELLNSSRFMLRMTDNILTRFKIENGECTIKKSLNSIKKTVQTSVDYLKFMIQSKKQTVKIKSFLKNEKDYIFEFDAAEIERVLINIISNASEFSPQNTDINITLNKDERNVLISVQDFGCGISKDVLDCLKKDKILKPKRLKKVGSGSGLYIAKKIAEAHEGKLEIETNCKGVKGTTLTLFLPCKNKETNAFQHQYNCSQ